MTTKQNNTKQHYKNNKKFNTTKHTKMCILHERDDKYVIPILYLKHHRNTLKMHM